MKTPVGDLRWTTVVSLDLVGFTELTQELGEERVFALLQRVLDTARSVIEGHGGYVVDTAGDGVLATFGAPHAVENAPVLACRAATDILTHMQTLPLEGDRTDRPQLRIGIAGGNTMVVRGDGGTIRLVGDPVNIAARLQAVADPGAIVLSDEVMQQTHGAVQGANVRSIDLKGIRNPVVAHDLVGLVETSTRFEGAQLRGTTAFVSREKDLDELRGAFGGGPPFPTVVVSGVAGIGKSRLLYEAVQTLSQDWSVVTGQCAPDKTARPFAAFDGPLLALSGSPPDTPVPDQLETIRNRWPKSMADDGMARFCTPRSQEKDPVGRILHDRSFLAQMCSAINEQDPHIFVFEDLHWADRSTRDTLLAMSNLGVPIIATTRTPDDPYLAAATRHISLAPLSVADTLRIVQARTSRPISAALFDRLAQTAEGIPLIAEELALAVDQSDDLHTTTEGLDLADDTGTIFTGNLQQLVLSRVDRLNEHHRHALQVASVLGRDFEIGLLNDILETPIEALEDFEGILTQLGSRTGRFSHALIRQAVYGGLLSQRRKNIHFDIARHLQARSEGAEVSVLAHHFVSADRPDHAAPVLVSAGEEALLSYELMQADVYLTQAFNYAMDQPEILSDEDFGRLAMLWTRTLSVIGNYGKIMEVAPRLQARLAAGPYSSNRSVANALIALAQTGARDYEGARDLLLQTIEDGEANNDPYGAAWAKSTLARVYDETNWAPQSDTRTLCRQIIPVAEHFEDRHLLMSALYIIVASYRACGRRTKAMEATDDMEAMAEKYDDRRARGYANSARALVFTIGGDPETATTFLKAAQRDFLADTTDSRVIIGIELFTEIFTTPPEQVRPRLEAMHQIALDLRDHNLIHSINWIQTVLEIKAGSLAKGWAMTDRLVKAFHDGQNVNLIRQIHMTRAEVLLAIAGLIDPDAESPPDRPKFPRERPRLADIATFARLKLTARSRATKELEACLAVDPENTGVNYARAQIGLGLIEMSKGHKAKARARLEEGHAIAEAEGIDVLTTRANVALAQI